jgi:ribosomal protein L12E/L44/L45/RPP1/RPP2
LFSIIKIIFVFQAMAAYRSGTPVKKAPGPPEKKAKPESEEEDDDDDDEEEDDDDDE